MKAILEFNLPDDEDSLKLARDGPKWFCVVCDFYEDSIRRRLKYDSLPNNDYHVIETLRDELHTVMDDNGVSLDDVS